MIEVCKARNLQFIQVSTMSTMRSGVKGEVDEMAIPTEKTLCFRQNLINKYVPSKFLAERLLLDAVAEGLRANESQIVVFPKNNLYTMQVLYRLRYSRSLTMSEYVEKFVNMFQ